MRRSILAVVLSGIVGCTSTTVYQDGNEVSVIVESASLFSDVSTLTEDAKKAACPDMMFKLSDGKSSAAHAREALPQVASADGPLPGIESLTNLINAVDKLHESVKEWLGRTTVKLTGTCD